MGVNSDFSRANTYRGVVETRGDGKRQGGWLYSFAMKLMNFEVASEIEFESGGHNWELHNFACFDGLELRRSDNSAVMRWTVPTISDRNPWGSSDNHAIGMELHFEGLKFLHVGPRDPELPMTEDESVASVMKVEATSREPSPWLRTKKSWREEDAFRLVFEFQSARTIEIESESVQLIPMHPRKP